MTSLWNPGPCEDWAELPDIAWTEAITKEVMEKLPKCDPNDPRDEMFRTPVRTLDLLLDVD